MAENEIDLVNPSNQKLQDLGSQFGVFQETKALVIRLFPMMNIASHANSDLVVRR